MHLARAAQIREWPEHEPVDDAEHRDVGADAQRQRDDDGGGKAGGVDQPAHGVANVLQECVERGEPPGVPAALAQTGDVADAAPRRGARFGRRNSLVGQVAREQFHVRLELTRQLPLHLAPAAPGQQAADDLAERHASASRSTRVVAATDRRKASSSSRSCRRPAAVMR